MLWRNDWGDATPDKDEMWDWVMERMDEDDFETELFNFVGFHDLLDWARKQNGFFEDFEDDIMLAEQSFFDNHVWWEDDDDEN